MKELPLNNLDADLLAEENKMGLRKWFDIVIEFLPAIIGVINPALIPIAVGISESVSEVEKIFGPSTGPQKLAAVQNVAQDIAVTANAAGAKIDVSILNDTIANSLKVGIDVVNLLTKKLNS